MTYGVNMRAILTALAFIGLSVFVEKTASAESANDGAELFQQSYDREAGGKLQDALQLLDKLPPPRKDSYVASVRRAWLLYRLGRHGESIESYQRAIAAAPQSIEARSGLILPQQALRRWGDAEATARALLESDPQNFLGTLRLAFSLYNLGRFAEAAGLYSKLKERYPSDGDVRSGLGWSLLKQGKPADAAREFRELLQVQPRHVLGKQGLEAAGLGRAL